MRTTSIFAAACAALALASVAPAQDLATTLDALTRGDAWIVRARVLHVREVAARVLVRFATLDRVRGGAPERFDLDEPSGRSCGRSLRGVVPGASYLVFLQPSAVEVRLAASSARAVVNATPAVVAHVRALNERDPLRRVELLAESLSDRDDRLRRDAALALQIAPGLERASDDARRAIFAALRAAVDTGSVDLVPLLTSSARCPDAATLDLLVPWFARGDAPELDRAVLATLSRFDSAEVARRVPAASAVAGPGRVIRLIGALQPREAAPLLTGMFASEDRNTRVAAQAQLLRLGARPNDLRRLGAVADEVQAAATQTRARRPFHSIDPWMIR